MKAYRKKVMTATLACCLFLGVFPLKAYAYSVPETVRVGLESVYKNVTSFTVKEDSLRIGRQSGERFVEDGIVESDDSFTLQLMSGSYVRISENFSDYEEAADLADSLQNTGLSAYAAYLEGDWSVIVTDASRSEVERVCPYSTESISFEGTAVKGREILLLAAESTQFAAEDDILSIGSKEYRGRLEAAINGSTMTAVNVIALEEYLYGVLPAEMPSYYEEEALKAQAVAARTYAMTKLGAHTGSGYQLCDTTACQVYNGYSGEAAATNRAVDRTAGEVVCYNGTPIEAVFSSSMGGYTENSENVWYSTVPYLQAVPEMGEYGSTAWERTYTLDDIDALLESKGENIGRAEDIVITKISSGGRVQELKIIGSKGEVTLTKESIRTYFSAIDSSLPSKMFTINGKGGEIGVFSDAGGYQNAASSNSLVSAMVKQGIVAKTMGTLSALNGKTLQVQGLESTQSTTGSGSISVDRDGYEEQTVYISTVNSDGTFVFEGYGSGHGVGLSQKGAQYMAQQGYNYQDILLYYYTDVTIEG